jgi:hypothetical protein
MTTLTQLRVGIVTAGLTAAALLTAPLVGAATITVSPGDRVDYVSPVADTQFCTIGYVYTATDRRTYAITAGHCRTTNAGYARDKRSGLTGGFIRAVFDPPSSGGADYGLIDFGIRTLPLSFIGNTPTSDDHPQPRLGQSVCHTGVSSGQHCGRIVATHGDDQYLTAGMPASIPGDSGGPVWVQKPDGYAQIIGIWLGEKTTAAGGEYGRFASLAAGLHTLGVT